MTSCWRNWLMMTSLLTENRVFLGRQKNPFISDSFCILCCFGHIIVGWFVSLDSFAFHHRLCDVAAMTSLWRKLLWRHVSLSLPFDEDAKSYSPMTWFIIWSLLGSFSIRFHWSFFLFAASFLWSSPFGLGRRQLPAIWICLVEFGWKRGWGRSGIRTRALLHQRWVTVAHGH